VLNVCMGPCCINKSEELLEQVVRYTRLPDKEILAFSAPAITRSRLILIVPGIYLNHSLLSVYVSCVNVRVCAEMCANICCCEFLAANSSFASPVITQIAIISLTLYIHISICLSFQECLNRRARPF